jgi:hypothetical protein
MFLCADFGDLGGYWNGLPAASSCAIAAAAVARQEEDAGRGDKGYETEMPIL